MPRCAWLAPATLRPGGPELWVAGVSPATLRRAARTGVWHPVALPPDDLGRMASDFRRLCPGGRVVMRLGVYFADEPKRVAVDERGRHALAGPPQWLAQQLVDTEAGVSLSTRIAPDRLDKAHRARIRAALNAVDAALELVSEGRM